MEPPYCCLCGEFAASLFLDDKDRWVCRHCRASDGCGVYFKEVGTENPYDPKGSTAHVRDIKNRRLDPKTQKMFYAQPAKTYFFPQKG